MTTADFYYLEIFIIFGDYTDSVFSELSEPHNEKIGIKIFLPHKIAKFGTNKQTVQLRIIKLGRGMRYFHRTLLIRAVV